jgi:Spherulation-specific family 4
VRSPIRLVLAALVFAGLFGPNAQGISARVSHLRIAVPAYIFSDDLRGWEAIIERAEVTPIVVINPRNGPDVFHGTRCDSYSPPDEPGTGPDLSSRRIDDPEFVTNLFFNDPPLIPSQANYQATLQLQFIRRVEALKSAGIEVYGYVWSNTNGADPSCPRGPGIIGLEIDRYRQVYGISNVFFDDASNQCPAAARTAHTDVAKAKGAKIILNPGSIAGTCLAAESDVVVNFEGSPNQYAAQALALNANALALRQADPSGKIWHILHSATDGDVEQIVNQAESAADYLYVTDDVSVAHGCDGGGSTFDSLYGMWPIIRGPEPACFTRFNGKAYSWGSLVRRITGVTQPVWVLDRRSKSLPVVGIVADGAVDGPEPETPPRSRRSQSSDAEPPATGSR